MTNKYSWDNLAQNLREDALQDSGKKGYSEDTRFYKLARNENDMGGAVVRLVPDPDGIMFIKMIRINADKGANRRFCKDWSPQSIEKACPFNEKFLEEWRAGNKEEAKRFGRSIRYLTNIKVIKDPANPANEGKIFLYDMSQTIYEKVKGAAQPTPDEIALGQDPKDVYNPLAGNNFILKVNRGSNNFITYENSKFDEKITALYASEAEADKDLANGFKLGDFYEPSFFKTYEELLDCRNWYTGEKDSQAAQGDAAIVADTAARAETKAAPAPVEKAPAPVETVAPTAVTPAPVETATVAPESDDIDDILDDILA